MPLLLRNLALGRRRMAPAAIAVPKPPIAPAAAAGVAPAQAQPGASIPLASLVGKMGLRAKTGIKLRPSLWPK